MDDPAVVKVVDVPPRSSVVRAADGSLSLRWPHSVGRVAETKTTALVDGTGHLAPHLHTFDEYEIQFPVGQVAICRAEVADPAGTTFDRLTSISPLLDLAVNASTYEKLHAIADDVRLDALAKVRFILRKRRHL